MHLEHEIQTGEYRWCLLGAGNFDGGPGPSADAGGPRSQSTSLCRASATSQEGLINTAGVAARAQSTSQCSHSIHKLADNIANFFWHGCGEHHHLLLSWALHEQGLDIFSHVCTQTKSSMSRNSLNTLVVGLSRHVCSRHVLRKKKQYSVATHLPDPGPCHTRRR